MKEILAIAPTRIGEKNAFTAARVCRLAGTTQTGFKYRTTATRTYFEVVDRANRVESSCTVWGKNTVVSGVDRPFDPPMLASNRFDVM